MKRLYLFIFSMLLGGVFAQGPALTIGDVDYNANTIDVYYEIDQVFAGFQFNIEGVTLTDGVFGGVLDDFGMLNVYVDPDGVVLAFSWTPIEVPAGAGLLLTLPFSDIDYTDICLVNGTFAAPGGQNIVTGLTDCVDCDGVHYGSAFYDDCNECSGGTTGHMADSDKDCFGDCFGTAFLDDCFECVGGNTGMDENWAKDCVGTCFGTNFSITGCLGCTDPWATNYDPAVWVNDGTCTYPPDMFWFSQSSDQSAYFVEMATLNGVELDAGDWIAGFNGDVCVGATEWMGPFTGLVLMGYLPSEPWTDGYLVSGEVPTFMIYDVSQDIYRDAMASGVVPGLEFVPTGFVNIDLLHAEQDCFGVWGGPAYLDMCGTCDDDPFNDCVEDCNGIWGGDGVYDNCFNCDNDPSNDCIEDCAGEWGGSAIIDDCGNCAGGSTGMMINYAQDCAGVCGGTAVMDVCNQCVGGTTCIDAGWALDDCGVCFGGNADMDCAGDCFGLAVIDDCGDCTGGTSGMIYNESQDCNGDCSGSAFLDSCGECSGGNSGHLADSDIDCDGVCFGGHFFPECFGCTDDFAINWDPNAIIDDGSCYYPPDLFWFSQSTKQAFYFMELATSVSNLELEAGDWIGAFNAGVCVGATPWAGPFTALGTMGFSPDEPWTAGYMEHMDIPTFIIYDASLDTYFPAHASGVVPGLPWIEQTFIEVELLAVYQDCNGEWGGTAFVDMCGDCVGGSTGLTYCTQDCAGTWGGNAYMDICGSCDDNPGNDGADCTGCMDPAASNFDPTAILDCGGCCVYYYDIDLHAGANLISFYGLPLDNTLDNVLAPLDGNAYGVIGNGVAAVPMNPLGWIGSLVNEEGGFLLTSGYWLKLWSDASLQVVPDQLVDEFGNWVNNPVYDLTVFPNLISYPYNEPYLVTAALPNAVLNQLIGIIGEGTAMMPHPMNPGQWVGNLTHFEPTKGYYFKMNAPVTMSYNPVVLARNYEAPVEFAEVPAEFKYNQSSQQAFYFIEDVSINGMAITTNDYIVAYNGDVLVGARQWTGEFTDVPVMGYAGDMDNGGYAENGDRPSFKVYQASSGSLIDVYADNVAPWSDKGMFTIGVMDEVPVVIPEQASLNAAFPNPFNPSTTIGYSLPNDMSVKIQVVDMTGRQVAELANDYKTAGYHSVTWNAAGQSSGVYFIRMIGEGFAETQKVMLVK